MKKAGRGLLFYDNSIWMLKSLADPVKIRALAIIGRFDQH